MCRSLGDPVLFETAEILMTTGLSGRGRTRHLKGPMYKGKTPWKNNRALLKDVDQLPKGPQWSTAEVSVGEGLHKRTRIVYYRDVLEVVRELIGASRFRQCLKYAPERYWTSDQRTHRVYNEMWSGDWWWRTQYLIRNPHGTIVPLIVATDETTLTNNPQGPKGYPVYLSIGNISKSVRRRPTKRAMIIIGYLPVDSFEDVPDVDVRARYHGELLHKSLSKVFEPLKSASSNGMLAWCADGALRHVYPIIAAWVADWPEQNNIACTVRSGCPRCRQKWKGRGRGSKVAPLRDRDATLKAFKAYRCTQRPVELKPLGLKPWPAFWEDIPDLDIGMCFAPDLLHQLYKGMFEHAKDWVEDLLGTNEFNHRFRSMPQVQDLRHFKQGVTKVKVWSGRESREMMRQFLPIVIDSQAPPDFVRLIRSLLDFSYLAQGKQLTDVDLTAMESALDSFHRAKGVLVSKPMEIVPEMKTFDRIPKLHMLSHYTQSIRELGTPDGYSTETPEHLHILYVKNGWRMSNRRDPLPQIVSYVRRLEAIEVQRTFIDEYYGGRAEAKTEGRMEYESDGEESLTDQSSIKDDRTEDEGYNEDENKDEDDTENDTVRIEPDGADTYYEYRYPRPTISIAREPTIPNVPGHMLVSSYGASDLIRALRRFLSAKARLHGEDLIILPSDLFDVWHKATLTHSPLSCAPTQPCHRDVVRISPLVRDTAGHVRKNGAFDTALFAANGEACGLPRFRAGLVRTIFTLPSRLKHLYSGPLVYLDVYMPFKADATGTHHMYSTTCAYSGGCRASIVLPLTTLVFSCHLAPDFALLSTTSPLGSGLPRGGGVNQRFFFNDFYNHFTYLLMTHWRRIDPT